MFCIPFQVATTPINKVNTPGYQTSLSASSSALFSKNHLTWDCQLCGIFMKILKIPVLKSIKIRIRIRLSRFSFWVTIYRFSLLMYFPTSVQSSTCSTLGPASLHVPVLSFCTDLIGQLFFCTEHINELLFFWTYFVGDLCLFAQILSVNCVFFHRKWILTSISSGVLRALFKCEHIELSLIGRSLVTLCLHIFKTASTF